MSNSKRTLSIEGNEYEFHVCSDEVEGLFDLTEVNLPVGGLGVPMHQHHSMDEVFHVFEGEVAFDVAGEEFVLGAGDCVKVPAGTLHAWRNESDEPACMTFTHIKHATLPPFIEYLKGLQRYFAGKPVDLVSHTEAHDSYFEGVGFAKE